MTKRAVARRRLALVRILVAAALAPAGSVGPAQARPAQPAAPIAASGTTPIAVFGSDDRSKVPAQLQSAADKIGLLFNNRSRTVCSAFCVGERMIATAAHCLARFQSGVRLSDFVFARNFDRQRDLVPIEGHASGSAAQSVLSGDFRLRVRPPIDAVHDWALIRLAERACPAGGLPITEVAPADLIRESAAGRVFQLSYHRDWTQWRVAYSKPCRIERDFPGAPWSVIAPDFMDADQMLLHTCDTGGASSGSPLLLETPRGPVVVGINVGTYVQARQSSENGTIRPVERAETIANTAVSVRVLAGRIEQLRGADLLQAGAPVRQLQEFLAELDLYEGRLDGSYGPQLRLAIETYERARRLPVTGLATSSLRQRLQRERAGRGTVAPSVGTGEGAR